MTHPDPQLVMTGDEHYREAERLLQVAHDEQKNIARTGYVLTPTHIIPVPVHDQTRLHSPLRLQCDPASVTELRALAATHAQLALASATWSAAVLNDAAHNVTVNIAERDRTHEGRRGWRR